MVDLGAKVIADRVIVVDDAGNSRDARTGPFGDGLDRDFALS
ncbi:hypothetical protein SDC9_165850 [bioreactor metagenome]|uniref:Uncharacterized protein n=1 Tax=bioreactor metagenome TaxID=1076179 RepID=A0A645FXW8_9ZZZZ